MAAIPNTRPLLNLGNTDGMQIQQVQFCCTFFTFINVKKLKIIKATQREKHLELRNSEMPHQVSSTLRVLFLKTVTTTSHLL